MSEAAEKPVDTAHLRAWAVGKDEYRRTMLTGAANELDRLRAAPLSGFDSKALLDDLERRDVLRVIPFEWTMAKSSKRYASLPFDGAEVPMTWEHATDLARLLPDSLEEHP